MRKKSPGVRSLLVTPSMLTLLFQVRGDRNRVTGRDPATGDPLRGAERKAEAGL